MERFYEYKDFPNEEQKDEESQESEEERERKLNLPPVIASEILVDYLTFKGRGGQEYRMAIFKDRRTFRIYYPETWFMLKDGNFDETDLVDKRGAEPDFFRWVKIMLDRYRPCADEV